MKTETQNKNYAKTLNIALLIGAIIPVTKIIALPALLSERAGRGLWLCAIITFTADLVLICLITLAYKNYKRDFFTALELTLGKITAKIITGIYALYFIVKSLVLVLGEKYFMENAYYEETTVSYIFFPFFALCFYLCYKGIKVYEKLSFALAILAFIGFTVVFLLCIPQSDFENLLPIKNYYVKGVLRGSYFTLSYTGEGLYLLFFLGRHKQGNKVIAIPLSSALSYAVVVLFLAVFYGAFYTISPCKLFAVSQLSHYSRILSSVGRVDTLAIFMLDLVRLFALCLPLSLSAKCFSTILGEDKKRLGIISATITAAVFIFTIIFSEKNLFVTNLFCKIFTPLYIVLTYIATPLLLFICKEKNEKNGD